MDLGIAGRAALVGGGSEGLGLASARALAAEGVRVAVVARREAETRSAAEAIARDFSVETLPLFADLSKKGECERVVAEAARRFGGLDILVPNAGGPPPARFEMLDDEAWLGAFRLTYLSTVRLIRAALPHMEHAGWGRIVTIGSVVTAEPRPDLTLSSGVRTGLVALTRILGRQYAAKGICVNLVSPGYTLTRRQREIAGLGPDDDPSEAYAEILGEIPLGRMAEPEEIGSLVAFFCSERVSFVTGVNLLADGGQRRGI